MSDSQAEPCAEAAAAGSGESAGYVPVYTFYVYDHDEGTSVLYPRMATRRAIANMRGKVNEDTAMVVDESLLDVEGFFND